MIQSLGHKVAVLSNDLPNFYYIPGGIEKYIEVKMSLNFKPSESNSGLIRCN